MTGVDAEDKSQFHVGRRRYDSPVRREQAARTRQRIVDAGVALVRELPTWDWRGLTFVAVASRASVGERTVYRYFPTERDLHEAILARLQQDAGGVSYENLTLDDLPRVTARVHASVASLSVSHWSADQPQQPALVEVDLRRRSALAAAVAEVARDWPEADRDKAAAVLDVLWNLPAYERLMTAWNLDAPQATEALTWAISVVTDAIRSGRRPGNLLPGSRKPDHNPLYGVEGVGLGGRQARPLGADCRGSMLRPGIHAHQ
jgi:AcrR family transcriptional regulator